MRPGEAFALSSYGFTPEQSKKLVLLANVTRMEIALEYLSDFKQSCAKIDMIDITSLNNIAAEIASKRANSSKDFKLGVVIFPEHVLEKAVQDIYRRKHPHLHDIRNKTAARILKELESKKQTVSELIPSMKYGIPIHRLSDETAEYAGYIDCTAPEFDSG